MPAKISSEIPLPTPRDVIHVFDLALNLAEYAALGARDAVQLDECSFASLLEEGHLKQAFDKLYRAGHA